MGMGNIAAPIEGFQSVQSNVSGTAWKNESFALSSYRDHFLIEALGEKSISIGKSLVGKSLIINYRQQGDYRLKEQNVKLNYAQRFGKELALGLALQYYKMSFADKYGSRGVLYGSFGLQLKSSDRNKFSFNLINPNRQWLSKSYDQRIETRMTAAYSRILSTSFSYHLELSKASYSENEFRMGIEYHLNESFSMRSGFEVLHRRMSFGLSAFKEHFVVQLAISYMTMPGFSFGFGIGYKVHHE